MRRSRGVTLTELLVSLPIGLLVAALLSTLLLQTGRVYSAALHSAGVEQQASLAVSRLQEVLNRSSVAGVSTLGDGHEFAVQTIDGTTATGERRWSPTIRVYRYDPATQTLYVGEVAAPASDSPSVPRVLTQTCLEQAAASAQRVLITHLSAFSIAVEPNSPAVDIDLSVGRRRVRATCLLMSGLDV